MEIIHNAEMCHEFTQIMMSEQIEQSKQRTGFHRSDSIACPVKCYNRMTGMEAIYSERDIGVFIIGNLAHIALHKYFDAQEKRLNVGGVWVTIDAIHGIYPIESKTTRRQIYRKDQIPRGWIEQLAFAISVMDVEKGYLMVVNVITFAVMVWEVSIPKQERAMFKATMIAKNLRIAEAINNKNPHILEVKREECRFCCYRPSKLRQKDKGCPLYDPLPPKEKKKKTTNKSPLD